MYRFDGSFNPSESRKTINQSFLIRVHDIFDTRGETKQITKIVYIQSNHGFMTRSINLVILGDLAIAESK